MRFRKLRIAWSVFWGVAAVLLIALWVRSYWWAGGSKSIGYIKAIDRVLGVEWPPEGLGIYLVKLDGSKPPQSSSIAAPYWLLLPMAVALAIAPWIRWRFGLGTLVIAVTLVAALLGSAAYLLRN